MESGAEDGVSVVLSLSSSLKGEVEGWEFSLVAKPLLGKCKAVSLIPIPINKIKYSKIK